MKKHDISEQIIKAIENHNQWEQILELLIEYSGAQKGIITLRNMDTAELVLPEEVSIHHFSPMLKGIEPNFVESYISEFYLHDPWTDIEKEYHPHAPYVFSDFLPNGELEKTKFWEWLKPQGINDAAVVEIASSEQEWVALNLYFNNAEVGRKEGILSFLNEILPKLRHGWRISETVRALKDTEALGFELLALKGPYAFLNKNFSVKSANQDTLEELQKHLGLQELIEMNKTLALPNPVKEKANSIFEEALLQPKKYRIVEVFDSALANAKVTLTLSNATKNFVGKRYATYLVTVEYSPIWETKGLTQRQGQIVKYLAEGESIPGFAEEYGIKENTCYSHLEKAREKLGGMTVREIRENHLIYLEKTG